jgi:hypothetical protein
MTVGTPVERIGQMLEGAGYRRLASPLRIAGLSFEVRAAYVGTEPSPDLVLVADTAFDEQEHILRTVEGIGRALDIVKSKRPMTAVLAGPKPRAEVIEALSRVCRVLPVGVPSDGYAEAALHNWLAVLMPLTVPQPSEHIADPMGEIAAHLQGLDPAVAELVHLAPMGPATVQRRLHELLSAVLADNTEEDDPA